MGLDTHIVLIPSPAGPVPTPMAIPFSGPIADHLSSTVFVDNMPAAIVGSQAHNMPVHIPMGGPFQRSPLNIATVKQGSPTVITGDGAIARAGDPAECCNDPVDTVTGHIVVAQSTVIAG